MPEESHPAERYPTQWYGDAVVVSLPAEIDVSNADHVREDLLSLLNRGPATLIVDMGATEFCDSVGVNALVRASRRAIANQATMRLVVGWAPVQRVLDITGVDRLIPVYPSVEEALASSREPVQPEEAAHPGSADCAPADPDPGDTTPQPV